MPPTLPSVWDALAVEEVVARLAEHGAVEGVFAIGSIGREAFNPQSDYDLILVLRRPPVRLRVALTFVGGRLADIIFVEAEEIESLLAPDGAPAPAIWGAAQVRRWLCAGQILFDRAGLLQRAQESALAAPEPGPGEGEIYGAWFSVNYNLAQNRRMAASTDPAYLTALDLRLLFCLHDLWWYYFIFRGLPQRGEKAQVRYLETHDPDYMALFRVCLVEGDRRRKFQLYEELAHRTLAPLGAPWADRATAVLPEPGPAWTEGDLQAALGYWEELTGQSLPDSQELT